MARKPAVTLEDLAGHIALLEERIYELEKQHAVRLERLENKLDAVLEALTDAADAEDVRLIEEALAEQGDKPYIPLEQVKRELGLR